MRKQNNQQKKHSDSAEKSLHGLQKPVERLRRLPWRSPYLLACVVIVLFLSLLAGFAFRYANRYLPRTVLAGVPVGGLTRAEAETRVMAKVATYLENTITLTYDTQSWEFKPQELGSTFQVSEALEQIWRKQKSDRSLVQVQKLLLSPFNLKSEELGFVSMSVEGDKIFSEKVRAKVEQPYNETSLEIDGKKVAIVDGKPGKKVAKSDFEKAFYRSFREGEKSFAINLEPFNPELTSEQAEDARRQAENLLAADWSIVFGQIGNGTLTAPILKSWIATKVKRDAAGVAEGLMLTFKKEEVTKIVKEWAQSFDRKAVNGRVAVVEGQVKVIEEGKNGTIVDVEKTVDSLILALEKSVTNGKRELPAVVRVEQPQVRQDNIVALGLKELIGTGTTDFTGSPANRRTNITLGQKNLDGKVVMPGEVYSTVNELGPIEESSGFAIGLVIKNNRTVPEAGGGICQVSTTLFRAVLNAGLPVTERANHSYRVSYYERGVGPGLDATIYGPHPDFRWKNDLGSAVLVQSFIKGNSITFELYGTKDGRSSTVSAPTILETLPVGPPIYTQTDTLFVGEQVQIETPRDGAKTLVTYTVMRDGKEINKQVFRSNYKAWPAQYMVGTKERPAQ
jgi:vancomycin resistance protein YoaR